MWLSIQVTSKTSKEHPPHPRSFESYRYLDFISGRVSFLISLVQFLFHLHELKGALMLTRIC